MKLIIENLFKSYDEKEVLRDVNFTFEQGKIYGLIGRNGSGKTTLFNCINDDIDYQHGKFFLENNDIKQQLLPENIGYVISTPTVPEFLTAKEFLTFFIEINKEHITDLKTIDEYFDMVKIEKVDQDKLLKEYSHGMKNKMQMLMLSY